MSGIGHNGGPSMEAGFGFRKVAWTKARTELLPKLPLEILRVRVARAKRLGLPYRTYASFRAATGRDVVAFLYSGNALGVTRRKLTVSADMADHLRHLDGAAGRLAAIYAPNTPADVLSANPALLSAAAAAPNIMVPWGQIRSHFRGFAHAEGVPADGIVLVAATEIEDEWSTAAGFAGAIRPDAVLPPVASA